MPRVWLDGKKQNAILGRKWEDKNTGWDVCYQYSKNSRRRRLLQYRGITNEYTVRGKWKRYGR